MEKLKYFTLKKKAKAIAFGTSRKVNVTKSIKYDGKNLNNFSLEKNGQAIQPLEHQEKLK